MWFRGKIMEKKFPNHVELSFFANIAFTCRYKVGQ